MVIRNVFRIGYKVCWVSQAQGSTSTKEGIVVAVLTPGERPMPLAYPKLAKNCGSGRDHESYIIEVKTGAKKTLSTYYWPVVSILNRLPPLQ